MVSFLGEYPVLGGHCRKKPGHQAKAAGDLVPGQPGDSGHGGGAGYPGLCGKQGSSGFYKGQVTTKFGDWFMFDLGLATQSLCLAAWNLGLGTVVVGLFDHHRAAAVLGVPEGFELVAMLPLGYPAKQPAPPKRREISEFTHREKF